MATACSACLASILPELICLAEKAAGKASFPVEFLVQSAEEVPIESDSIDTAVTTWTLCTIPNAVRALREVRRALKPDGLLIFVEHGRAPEPKVVVWQDRLTPLWKRCAGGCHLNRKIDDLVRESGFNIGALHTGYAKGPRPMAFMYKGRARPS
jgi:ubiquinone/menaquinone biosynthesis C-methylase UbiE